jgi:hypothetical protein
MVCDHDRHGNQPGSSDNRYVLSHAANMPSDSPLIHPGSSGGPTPPLPRDHRAQRVDNSRNSARLPLYLAARRVVSNPFIIVVPCRSQTRHSHLVGHRLVISTSNTARTPSRVISIEIRARCCFVSTEPAKKSAPRADEDTIGTPIA